MKTVDAIRAHAQRSTDVIIAAVNDLDEDILKAAGQMIRCLEEGGRILACGNGGSASDALHFTAELVNRYRDDRIPLAAIALNADVATLTAIANDYHYDDVFSKQVTAFGRRGDILLAITTSGNSRNILKAMQAAGDAGVTTILLSGRDGGVCARLRGDHDMLLCVANDVTAHIQEAHAVIIHCLCAIIESHFLKHAVND
ncbi:MAG: phosphoheptose isomerase [marine bacterium B5-7]|nr:MAG: phosphoheptose isomerase [marine bacterium B5-7]